MSLSKHPRVMTSFSHAKRMMGTRARSRNECLTLNRSKITLGGCSSELAARASLLRRKAQYSKSMLRWTGKSRRRPLDLRGAFFDASFQNKCSTLAHHESFRFNICIGLACTSDFGPSNQTTRINSMSMMYLSGMRCIQRRLNHLPQLARIVWSQGSVCCIFCISCAGCVHVVNSWYHR